MNLISRLRWRHYETPIRQFLMEGPRATAVMGNGLRTLQEAGCAVCFFMSARPGIDKSYDPAWTSRATRHGQVVRLGMNKSYDPA